MTYRQSNFDPNAYEEPGPVVRPFNWVQWTGVALGSFGVAIFAYYLLGKAGWVPPIDSPMPGAVLPLLGVSLINWRREPSYDPAPELAAARRRWLIVIVAICAVILGAALVIEFTGA
jgi:hypothetical protein